MKALAMLVALTACVQQDVPPLPPPIAQLGISPSSIVSPGDRLIVRGVGGDLIELGLDGSQVEPTLPAGSYQHVAANTGLVGWFRFSEMQALVGRRLPDGTVEELVVDSSPFNVVAAPDAVFVDFSGNIAEHTGTALVPMSVTVQRGFQLVHADATHLYGFESGEGVSRIVRYARTGGREVLVEREGIDDATIDAFAVRGDRLVYGRGISTIRERDLASGADRELGAAPIDRYFTPIAIADRAAFAGQYRYVDGDVSWFLASENEQQAVPYGVFGGMVYWTGGSSRLYALPAE